MIKTVQITNHLGESIKLQMGGQDGSGLIIKHISGIELGTADINTTDLASQNGAEFDSAHISKRNIVFDLRLEPNPTVEVTRMLSYRYFPLAKPVKLSFISETRSCEIYGWVESNLPNQFSKDVDSQVSVICPDPYFYSLYNYLTVFYGVIPEFEFPFGNNSLTEPLITMGSIQNKSEGTIYYTGDIETGINIIINATGPAKNITIYNTTTGEIMKIVSSKLVTLTGSDIKAGDEIRIDTNALTITLHRDGNIINILNCLDKDADWFQLITGDNIFMHTAEEGLNFLQFKVFNRIVYLGM